MKAQISYLAVAATLVFSGAAFGQDKAVEPKADSAANPAAEAAFHAGAPHCPGNIGLGSCGIGEVRANCVNTRTGYPNPVYRLRYAAWDRMSPRSFYSYSRHGIEAQLTHQWNQDQMQQHPWHCQYNYWQYGRPTALVVPPNSAFQTVYSWGVAETRSVPIYHQFGRAYPGHDGGAAGQARFYNTPSWPSNTSQFGVYPVRGPF